MSEFSPAAVHNPANRIENQFPVKPQPPNTVECDGIGCKGRGVYFGAGRVENGVFVGFTGTCFRCGGKGWQTPADVARNRTYDRHRRYTL